MLLSFAFRCAVRGGVITPFPTFSTSLYSCSTDLLLCAFPPPFASNSPRDCVLVISSLGINSFVCSGRGEFWGGLYFRGKFLSRLWEVVLLGGFVSWEILPTLSLDCFSSISLQEIPVVCFSLLKRFSLS